MVTTGLTLTKGINRMTPSLELKLTRIKSKLNEGLEHISKYEKLSHNEGQYKLVYGEEIGIEIYAPHLIPDALTFSWMGKDWNKVLTKCFKDLEAWVEVEKTAPRDHFSVDLY